MNDIVKRVSSVFGYEYEAIMSFLTVETGGQGFDPATGKIIIQFEPGYFKRKKPFAPSGKWSVNGVERQKGEWLAFNNAFSIDPSSTMESTSIGIGQVMGEHWKRLGYASVGDMWDDAKKGIEQQIWQVCKFISTDKRLEGALKAHNWYLVAYIYNGSKFRQYAKKWGRVPYDISMREVYTKLKMVA
jgi:hypothetical protein